MISRRSALAVAIGLVAAGALGYAVLRPAAQPDSRPGGPFTLVDGSGAAVRDADFRGKYLTVYFGYTFCPDVCPTALAGLGTALDFLPPDKLDRLNAVFISVDPKRDHGTDLTAYGQAFHPKIIGLTGAREEIDRVVASYGAHYEFHGDPSGDDYSIDHTSIIYVMDPDGKFVTQFTHNATPEAMRAKLDAVIR